MPNHGSGAISEARHATNAEAPHVADTVDEEKLKAQQEFNDMPSREDIDELPKRRPRQQPGGKRGVSVRYMPEDGCGCDNPNCMDDDVATATAAKMQDEAQQAFERMCFDEARARAVKNHENRYSPLDMQKYVDGMPSESEVNIAEVVYPPGRELNLAEIPKYLLMKVVLDSGAGGADPGPRP